MNAIQRLLEEGPGEAHEEAREVAIGREILAQLMTVDQHWPEVLSHSQHVGIASALIEIKRKAEELIQMHAPSQEGVTLQGQPYTGQAQ
jgi:hypothetical protein